MGVTRTDDSMLRDIERKLKRMPGALKLATARVLEVFRSKIVPRTPVDTSRLVVSIQGDSPESIFFVTLVDRTRAIGEIGTEVPYARFPEFGTFKQAPQLYFTGGIIEGMPDAKATAANTIKSEVFEKR